MVIDLDVPKMLALRITIFTYDRADSNGWPSEPAVQGYVRFLQDRGIRVGFTRDLDNDDMYIALIDSSDVNKVVLADKDAAVSGIEKPPMVPESMQENLR